MSSKTPAEEAKPQQGGTTSSAWNSTLNYCGWAAAATWYASSNLLSSAKTALDKVTEEDLLETAKKPAVKAFAGDVGELGKAASEANISGLVKSGTNIIMKYVAPPEVAGHRVVTGSVAGAMLGGQVCGPQCAMIAGLAGGLYGHFKKVEAGDGDNDLVADDEKDNEQQNTK